MTLTSKQAAFVSAYLVDANGKQAAIKAGYAIASADVTGCQMLKHPKILTELARRANPGQVVPELSTVVDEIPAGMTPLAYMLGVVNDPDADEARRDRMAAAAAPYMHPKLGEGGKKDIKKSAAKIAEAGKFAPAAPPRLVVSNK